MNVTGEIPCGTEAHMLAYDGELTLPDHDLDRDLAFQALRGGTPEGCLAVRHAWLQHRWEICDRDFLEAMLTTEDEDYPRQRLIRQRQEWIAEAPRLFALLPPDQLTPQLRMHRLERHQWQLVLLSLPEPLREAFCRSLRPGLLTASPTDLRRGLLGDERDADILHFEVRLKQ